MFWSSAPRVSVPAMASAASAMAAMPKRASNAVLKENFFPSDLRRFLGLLKITASS